MPAAAGFILWATNGVFRLPTSGSRTEPAKEILAFLDDDDAFAPDQPGQSQRYGAPRQRPYLARRLIALAIGVGVIILLVVGFKACLDNRKQRSFENYNSDLSAIVAESQQLSRSFFERLQDPGDLTDLAFRAEVQADRSTAESLLQRVEGLNAPDEVAAAQGELELAYELRRDGIAGVADQVATALGNEGRNDAIEEISTFMRYFLASDVLYQRSREDIDSTLDEEEVPVAEDERLPSANFLPDPIEEWLNPTALGSTLSGISAGGDCAPGVHGLARVNTLINDTELTPDALTTVSGGGPYELTVTAENQGDTEETAVPVEFTLSGGTDSIDGSGEIDRIEPGNAEDARITIDPDPPTGEELTLEVNVVPVCGEEITENNSATFQVTF